MGGSASVAMGNGKGEVRCSLERGEKVVSLEESLPLSNPFRPLAHLVNFGTLQVKEAG